MTDHTVKAFDEDLRHLAADVAEMGKLACSQVTGAVDAMARADIELARRIVGQDERLDALEVEIERKAVRIIALRHPMAVDLRQILAAIKLAGNLERCGDLAKSIAKRVGVMAAGQAAAEINSSIVGMGRMVADRLAQVTSAYATGEVEQALAVWRQDEEIDAAYESLFRELLTYMMADPRTITACAHLLFVAKNLERIGDHATNIAELVHYQITGETSMGGARPKSDALV